jgi:hypothetical protein
MNYDDFSISIFWFMKIIIIYNNKQLIKNYGYVKC